ncbi:palmitoyltransferase for Vac8p [Coemansia sp. BCRC 34301]|nr:palmitoyltransferase for Vac8p [Coemansia sp. BCRC 34301]
MSRMFSLLWNRHKVYRALGVVPVLFTLGLMLWSGYTYALTVVPLIASYNWWLSVLCVGSTTMLWLLSIWAYAVCVYRKPGAPAGMAAPAPVQSHDQYTQVSSHSQPTRAFSRRTPQGRQRYADDDSRSSSDSSSDYAYSDDESPLNAEQLRRAELVYSITVRENGQPRFCLKCNGPKPDRTHHCSVCGECVLKMDHHCPWLNNCVGFRTQKAFILFVVYCALYCTLILVTSLIFFFRSLADMDIDTEISMNLIFLLISSCAFAIALFVFAIYHIYLVLTNTTTIESYEKNNYRVETARRGSRAKYVNLFDMGAKKNFIQVFGSSSSWYLWLVPVDTTLGDGVRFPISFEGYNELRQNLE